MTTGSVAHYRGNLLSGARSALGRATGAAVGVELLVTMLFNEGGTGLRNTSVFAGVVFLLGLNAIAAPNLERWFKPDPFNTLTLLLLANGILALAASLLDLYPHLSLLPRRSDYILRQAYFIIVWLPCLIGGCQVWATILPVVVRFFARYGVQILAVLAATDIGTAELLTDPDQAWDGYLYYIDKISLQFFVSLSFLFSTLFGRRSKVVIPLMFSYLAICRIGNAGTMFNTSNALLSFVILLVATRPSITCHRRVLLVGSICGALLVSMCAGIVSPHLYAIGQNEKSWVSRRAADAVWRAAAWSQNLSDLSASNFIGVGFGVPYHALTSENLLEVEAADWSEEAGIPASAPASEFLYIRGQHSSVINIFYRLGALGGLIFLVLNTLIFVRLAAASATPDRGAARLSVSAAALFAIAFVQIAVNVGLESPPVFVVYMMAMSFSLSCLDWIAASTSLRAAWSQEFQNSTPRAC